MAWSLKLMSANQKPSTWESNVWVNYFKTLNTNFILKTHSQKSEQKLPTDISHTPHREENLCSNRQTLDLNNFIPGVIKLTPEIDSTHASKGQKTRKLAIQS